MALHSLKKLFLSSRNYFCEFLATFIFVFVSSSAVISNAFYGDIGVVGVALVSGLMLSGLTYATAFVSGGQLNPAVSLALWFGGKIKGIEASFYITCQIFAGLAAGTVLLWLFGERAKEISLGGPVLGSGVSFQLGLILEGLMAAIFVFVYFATMVDRRGPLSFGPLVVGLVFAALQIFSFGISGGGINPARAVGTLIVAQQYSPLLVFIVGGATGSVLGLFYEFLFVEKVKKQ